MDQSPLKSRAHFDEEPTKPNGGRMASFPCGISGMISSAGGIWSAVSSADVGGPTSSEIGEIRARCHRRRARSIFWATASRELRKIPTVARSSVPRGNQIPIIAPHTTLPRNVTRIEQVQRHRRSYIDRAPVAPHASTNFRERRTEFINKIGTFPLGVLEVIPNLARHPCPRFRPGFGARGLCIWTTNCMRKRRELQRPRKKLQINRGVPQIEFPTRAPHSPTHQPRYYFPGYSRE